MTRGQPSLNKKKKSPSWRVRTSPIHGRGLFAIRTIRKGAKIIEYRGARISETDADDQPSRDPANPHHTFLFQLRDGTIIDAGTRGNSARWINHSCQPNCESIEYDDGTLFIHARRTIRAGEELCYDYRIGALGKATGLNRKDYACACKSPRCRGTLLLTPKRRGRKGTRTK
jgi:uncharacterized protein